MFPKSRRVRTVELLKELRKAAAARRARATGEAAIRPLPWQHVKRGLQAVAVSTAISSEVEMRKLDTLIGALEK